MSQQIIVDEPYALVWADEEVPCIIVQLYSFANRIQFKQLMNAGLAHFKAHSSVKQRWGWIADTRNMSAISKEVQQWLADDWNMQAYRAGLREVSIVTSHNILGQLATQQYAKQTVARPEKYVLEPVYYDSLEQAKQSVTKQCATPNQ
ncbi:hypothetical protein MTX78_23315 (plasmid) [Hymenobacter tibetensis]|uniref:Uncharacterized protein n=1 Tax=Hymenobacter tibetensis TaxID=497967 RepID=A0ABY4D4I7_9BACT|nr:hypothetical protein [Hymenobacter tibetensis]UOG77360.1 hypothetical protein MTX78_23315 [Hymenobacter tibetensis]